MSKKQKRAMSVRAVLGIVSVGTILAYFLLNVLTSSLFMERFYLRRTKRRKRQYRNGRMLGRDKL